MCSLSLQCNFESFPKIKSLIHKHLAHMTRILFGRRSRAGAAGSWLPPPILAHLRAGATEP